MSTHSTRAATIRVVGVLLISVLSVISTGCYTRQIEGIQRDLDLMDRKLHKVNTTQASGDPSEISPQEILEIKRELESVRSQQLGLTSDLETLRVENNQMDLAAGGPEPYPLPQSLPDSQEISMLKKQISSNQKKIDQFDRDMKEMQATFDEVRGSMLEVIQLLKQEYVEEGATPSPAASPAPSGAAAPEISLSTPSGGGGGNFYEVKAGDSLNVISKRYNVPVDQLMKMNEITNPDRLVMGQKIYIP
ncbi:MAG: LysM peptidoglycan-binding domain-containing protein [Candidatus Omnitrophica bacterium]|nr:LysM peptidoglycan-binding domain-containing protein [Candidatus Omnitrophota bacterium]